MTIKEDIAKVEGLVENLKNEIEAWFERHFSGVDIDDAKADLHQTLGTSTAASETTSATVAADTTHS